MRIRSTPVETLLRKGKALRREFLQKPDLLEVRIAILAGSTANEVADFLELLLLDEGIRPVFYHSQYNRYFEEAVLETQQLVEFAPHIVYVHTSSVNIQGLPPLDASESDLHAHISAEVLRFAAIWDSVQQRIGCMVIQNNFELPDCRLLGNMDGVLPGGRTRSIQQLNCEFASQAWARKKILINDVNSIASTMGLDRFHDAGRWFSYKLICTPAGSMAMANSIAAIIAGIYGRSRKCLVLDLDNTLWGGVIGDDGPEGIKIGKETPEAEAYSAFQQYCLALKARGVVLAACSKNSEAIAKQGFAHPDAILKLSDFASFRVNWEPKHENVKAIAEDLNLGLDSLVFVDDNPAEREIVSAQLPMVAVPDVGSDVANFIRILDQARYFEPISLSNEDLERANQYESNGLRRAEQRRFASYDEYLESLEMSAEIATFTTIYFERITQLINKTNQFNLTTRRYTLAEIEGIAADASYVTLYGKLKDKFGDNGLVSVIIGRREGQILHVDLWLMSCRVLQRDMELAMLDALIAACRQRNISEIRGYYVPTNRNGLVRGHYESLGFRAIGSTGGHQSTWKLDLSAEHAARNKRIAIKELVRD